MACIFTDSPSLSILIILFYYCPLNNYILHNIKRFMLDKPCFYQEFENERRLAHYGELMRKREICYLRSIRKA